MEDLRLLKRAKDYMDQLAQGVDPIREEAVPETSVLNQEQLIKCFRYVSEVLQREIDQVQGLEQTGAAESKAEPEKGRFVVTEEVREGIFYNGEGMTSGMKELADRINMAIQSVADFEVPWRAIGDWLCSKGYLAWVADSSAAGPIEKGGGWKSSWCPTEKGKAVGISSFIYKQNRWIQFSCDGQRFVVEHLQEIVDYFYEKKSKYWKYVK